MVGVAEGVSLAAIIAIAGMYGISLTSENKKIDNIENYKSNLISQIEKKAGKSFDEVKKDYWKGVGAATNASSRLDKGERDRLNDMANANAENAEGVMRNSYATSATEKLDAKRTADEQRAENSMKTVNTPLYTPNGQQNYDENTSISIPSIEDETNKNVETEVPLSSTEEWLKLIQDAQKAQWEREDEKQRHLEEREDSAYQRAVADMRKAGINPNLMNVTPSESGMVTSSTGMDFSTVTTQMNNEMKELLESIDKNFSGNENEKDRIIDFITSLGQIAVMFAAISGKSKKGG